MRDPCDASAMVRLDRNHETIVAHRDQFILNRFRRPAHQAFERAGYARTHGRDLVTDIGQFGLARSSISPSGRILLVIRATSVLRSRGRFSTSCQSTGRFPAQREWQHAPTAPVRKARSLQNRERIEARSLDTQTRDRFRRIGDPLNDH